MTVNGKQYYTNITNVDLLEKCENFFSTGCESYAVSFHNNDADKIVQTIDDGFDIWMLRDVNMNFVFIPDAAKNAKNGKELLTKYKLDLIELI